MSDSINPAQTFSRPVLLRQAREAAGLHIAALAAALKVPVKKLEALEAGRYEELPDLTFARALASSACRQLKVDPSPVLEQIPLGHQPVLGENSGALNAPFKARQEAASGAWTEWLRRPAVLVSAALVLGAAGLLLMPDWDASTSTLRDAAARWGLSTAPSDSAPAPPLGDMPPATSPVSDVVQGGAGQAPVTAAAPSLPAAEVPEVGAVAGDTLLRITATADSWVEVVDGAGKSQVQRMLKTGDVLDFSSTPPYSVVVGRADAVEVSVRGQAFDVMPYARNSVARFQVK